MHYLIKLKKVDENHLLDFNCCLYCVFKVSDFYSIGFTFFKLFDNLFIQSFLCNTFGIGFDLVGFAVELECYQFAFNQFTIDFKGCF